MNDAETVGLDQRQVPALTIKPEVRVQSCGRLSPVFRRGEHDPAFARLEYPSLYQGIDLLWREADERLEYEYLRMR